MYTVVVRIYAAFLWLGLLIGYLVGYYATKNYAEQAAMSGATAPSPVVGGLLGLFISILVLGAGFTLVGIYENTLATANALRRNGGYSPSETDADSSRALREALPMEPSYQLAVAIILLAVAAIGIYFLIPKFGP